MVDVSDPGPLDWRVSIVDKSGRPSPEFQRRWNTNRNNTANIGTITFGAGPPSGSPADGAEYADTSSVPFVIYLGEGGTWHKSSVSKFTELSDVPHSYTGQANKLVRVNTGETALEFIPAFAAANPIAVASDTAVNGTASTFMRSDAAPAVQLATTSDFGLVKPDGTTITIAGGVITSVGGGGGGGGNPVANVVFTTNGSGGAITIRHSFNVTSVTRSGTGLYTVTFTTPFADTYYGVSGDCRPTDFANTDIGVIGVDRTVGKGLHTGSCDIVCTTVASSVFDPLWCSVQFFNASTGGGGGGGGGSGTVTSVDMTVPAELSVSGNPITAAGTFALSWATENPNLIFAGPSSGSAATPGFRALVAADIPTLPYGTVSSVALTAPSILTVAGSPITSTGTLALSLATQAANLVWAGPTTGSAAAPTFRALVAADIPSLPYGTGTVTSVNLATPSILTVSGNPITTSGTITLALATQSANLVWAGPSSGSATTPTFRALTAADIPSLPYGTGTVTSVAATVPAEFSISGSPVTTTGTLAITKVTQSANTTWAGPTSGSAAAPTFRALVTADLPTGTGTVTSVAQTVPAEFSISGSPVTTSGTLAITKVSQAINTVWAGPSSGSSAAPTFRALATADIPSLPYVTSVAATVPAEFSISGSPITSSGTLAITKATQTAHFVWAGPTSGSAAAPTFRALVATDIPSLSYVTSVALTLPSFLSVSGSPITSSGTLSVTLANQVTNTFLASPAGSTGTPSFRVIDITDIPSLSSLYLPIHGTADNAQKWLTGRTITVTGASTGSVSIDGSANVTLNLSAGSVAGTVTSVAASVAGAPILSVSGSPITSSGTLSFSLTNQNPNLVFAGPNGGGVSGVPTFRALAAADMPAGTGTVTSVGLTLPSIFNVSGSPVTTSGALTATLVAQNSSFVFAGTGLITGVPAFRALVATDIPDLSATYLKVSNNLSDVASTATARTNLGLGTMAVQNATAVAITGGAASFNASSSVNIAGATGIGVGIFNLTNTAGSQVNIGIISNGNSGNVVFRRGNGSYASPTALALGDRIGSFNFQGHDGTAYSTGTGLVAGIATPSGATWTTSDHGTEIQFSVVKAGTTTQTATWRVGADANFSFYPGVDSTYDIGQSTLRPRQIWASSAVIVTPVAVASLPTASAALDGARAFVNNALAPTFGAAVVGGGAVHIPVYCDGSGTPAWKVG